jgi:hypothetical protein
MKIEGNHIASGIVLMKEIYRKRKRRYSVE